MLMKYSLELYFMKTKSQTLGHGKAIFIFKWIDVILCIVKFCAKVVTLRLYSIGSEIFVLT